MRSANPVLSDRVFQRSRSAAFGDTQVMTVEGTAMKTGILLVFVFAAAAFTWTLTRQGDMALAMGCAMGGALVALISAFVAFFKPTTSPYAAPIYAIAEGLLLGGLSSIVDMNYPGIAIQATCLTFGTLFSLLIAYQSGWIRATEKFKLGVFAATGGIFLVYIASFVLSLFGVGIPYIHGAGPIGIGFSVFVVIIAALNLVLDFDFIDRGSRHGAPKFMEWYGALGLLVTLVWLYIEILHLLSKLQSRD